MEADLNRIAEMEALLEKSAQLLDSLDGQLDALDRGRGELYRLFRYCGSEAWYADREAELPPGLSAGVLGEDAVYDRIAQARDAAIRMLELSADMLKNL